LANGNCIDEAVVEGAVRAEKASVVKKLWKEKTDERVKNRGMTEEQARLDAAQEILTTEKLELKRQDRLRMVQAIKQSGAVARVLAVDPSLTPQAARALLEFDMRREVNGPNVQQTYETLRNEAGKRMLGFILKFKKQNFGLWKINKNYTITDRIDIAKGLHGEKVENPNIQGMVDGIKAARQYLVDLFNAAGGEIRLRKDWGWVQSHNVDAMRKVPMATWVDYTMSEMKRDAMLNDAGQPLSDGELRQRLSAMYIEHTTKDPELNHHRFVSPVNNRVHHRELIFKDAEAWLRYADRFGQKDILNAIQFEMDRLAKDVALLQILGPYPRSTIKALEKLLPSSPDRAQLRGLFNQVTGGAYIPLRESVAKWTSGYRSISTAAKLGTSLFINVTSDPILTGITASMNGIPISRVMGEYVKLLASPKHRRAAARAGYMAQGWMGDLMGIQRLMGEFNASHAAAQVSDTMMRMVGVPHHTESLRNAYNMAGLGEITEHALNNKGWENLPKRMQKAMSKRGVTKENWDHFRETKPTKDPETGAEFIYIENMWTKYHGDEAAARHASAQTIGDWLAVESKYAVVAPTERTKSWLSMWGQPGSVPGETIKMVGLFRSFTIAYTALHGNRALSMEGGFNKAMYATALTVPLTLAGALVVQMANLSMGKETEDTNTASFWLRAMARGGAWGPASDFLGATVTDNDNAMYDFIGGPVVSDAVQAGRIGQDLAQAFIEDNKAAKHLGDAGSDVVKLIRGLTPGSSLWYTKLAMERLVWDRLQLMLDPGAPSKWAYAEKMAMKEKKQKFYSPRGSWITGN